VSCDGQQWRVAYAPLRRVVNLCAAPTASGRQDGFHGRLLLIVSAPSKVLYWGAVLSLTGLSSFPGPALLIRFRAHLNLWEGGRHAAELKAAVPDRQWSQCRPASTNNGSFARFSKAKMYWQCKGHWVR
jgi:hypothetical protein